MDKVIKIIAGPNGSGKTTFAETFVLTSKPMVPFLNPDLIAAAFESTLSGLTYASLLSEAKKAGYKIIIHFIFLDKISRNLARIKKRVMQGGHNIPAATVRRRHLRCFENFWNIYRPLCDEWMILDNSGIRPKLVQTFIQFENLGVVEKGKFVGRFLKGNP